MNAWTEKIARMERDRDRLLQSILDRDTRTEAIVDLCRDLVDSGAVDRLADDLAARVREAAACPDCGTWPCVCDMEDGHACDDCDAYVPGAETCSDCEGDR